MNDAVVKGMEMQGMVFGGSFKTSGWARDISLFATFFILFNNHVWSIF